MTKVVVQGRDYWLRDEFWQETRDAGFEPLLVEIRNGVVTTRAINRDEFAAQFTGRIANWVRSEPKSVSVFREALGRPAQLLFNPFYRDVIVSGLESVAREFTARTGAQGKVRLPAEASFVVFIQDRAKDGSPQLHAHIAVCNRVRVQGREKTYATHTRELYQLRTLFARRRRTTSATACKRNGASGFKRRNEASFLPTCRNCSASVRPNERSRLTITSSGTISRTHH